MADISNKIIPEQFPQLKEAENAFPVIDEIRKRWSVRSFSDQPVETEKIMSLFEAARWSPSSMNEQPWRFIYSTKDHPEAHLKIASLLYPGNRSWAENAPVLILSLAKNVFQGGQPNIHALHDLGGAHMAISLQAVSMNLYLHQMAGFDSHKAKTIFQLPEDMEPVVVLAVGYRKEPSGLEEPFFTRETSKRQRKPIREIAFLNAFSQEQE